MSRRPIEPELAAPAARLLAERYDGDPNSAAWRHYGRLAGFENRKPVHRRANGSHPSVVLRAATGEMAPTGPDLLEVVRARLAATPPAPRIRIRAVWVGRRAGESLLPLGQLYRRAAARLVRRCPVADLSHVDWMIVLSRVSGHPCRGSGAGGWEAARAEGGASGGLCGANCKESDGHSLR